MIATVDKIETRTSVELVAMIRNLADNTIFSCEFVKRTTGEIRVMVCRLGVKKGQTGCDLRYNPEEKQLLPVYDMQKKDYRSISLDAVNWIKIRGVTYKVEKA